MNYHCVHNHEVCCLIYKAIADNNRAPGGVAMLLLQNYQVPKEVGGFWPTLNAIIERYGSTKGRANPFGGGAEVYDNECWLKTLRREYSQEFSPFIIDRGEVSWTVVENVFNSTGQFHWFLKDGGNNTSTVVFLGRVPDSFSIAEYKELVDFKVQRGVRGEYNEGLGLAQMVIQPPEYAHWTPRTIQTAVYEYSEVGCPIDVEYSSYLAGLLRRLSTDHFDTVKRILAEPFVGEEY